MLLAAAAPRQGLDDTDRRTSLPGRRILPGGKFTRRRVVGPGVVSARRKTPLLTVDEMDAAGKKTVAYRAPGA